MDQDNKKRLVAQRALDYIPDRSTLGVGTGSTVDLLIELLPSVSDRIETTVSSSERSSEGLRQQGFEVEDLNSSGGVDVYIDGADEATIHRQLIKGGGGAMTREKIVAAAARKFVCIVDDSKLVSVLGAFPLPVEVIPMARSYVARELVARGGQPVWRENFVTDNGNEILDVHNLDITDPSGLETDLNQIAGVVCVGLFAHRGADVLLVGGDDGIQTID